MMGLTFSSKLDWSSYIISVVKAATKKIGILIHHSSEGGIILPFLNDPFFQNFAIPPNNDGMKGGRRGC